MILTQRDLKRIYIFLTLLFFVFTLSSCNKNEYPKPTKDFYANDFAEALMRKTELEIIYEGEYLYEETKDIDEIGGTQIVVVTFLVENQDEVDEIDTTQLFREWEIGKNDMGVLIALFFTPYEDNGITFTELYDVIIEVGYRLEAYFVPGVIAQLRDDTLYGDTWGWFTDVALMQFIYEIENMILEDVYQMPGFTYDMDVFYDYLINGPDPIEDDDDIPFDILFYLFSSSSSFWTKLAVVAPVMFILLGTGYKFFGNRGGGGSSGGFRIRRRR